MDFVFYDCQLGFKDPLSVKLNFEGAEPRAVSLGFPSQLNSVFDAEVYERVRLSIGVA